MTFGNNLNLKAAPVLSQELKFSPCFHSTKYCLHFEMPICNKFAVLGQRKSFSERDDLVNCCMQKNSRFARNYFRCEMVVSSVRQRLILNSVDRLERQFCSFSKVVSNIVFFDEVGTAFNLFMYDWVQADSTFSKSSLHESLLCNRDSSLAKQPFQWPPMIDPTAVSLFALAPFSRKVACLDNTWQNTFGLCSDRECAFFLFFRNAGGHLGRLCLKTLNVFSESDEA